MMKQNLTFFLFSCAVFCLSTAKAENYTLYTTNTVEDLFGSYEVVHTWTFTDTLLDSKYKGVKLVSVKPELSGQVTLPGGLFNGTKLLPVLEIADYAFADSYLLESVTLSSSIRKLGDGVFANCISLTSVNLGDNLWYIGQRPFAGTPLSKVTLPANLLNMEGNIAAGLPFDFEIDIGKSAHFSMDANNCLYNKDKTKLYACPTLAETTVALPETLTQIMPEAFYGCMRLEYLEIPASVTKIGSNAFNIKGDWPEYDAPESEPRLMSVTYLGSDPAVIQAAANIYEGAPTELVSYAKGDAWKAIGATWCNRTLVVGSSSGISYTDGTCTWVLAVDENTATVLSVTPVPGTVITTLTVPQTIGDYVIRGIGNGAFTGLTSVEAVSLPDGLITIGKAPFSGTNLKSITLPYTIESIVGNPLAGCRYAKSIGVADDNLFFAAQDGLLFDKAKTTLLACVPSATAVTLPETLMAIGKDAFSGCSALKTVTALCKKPTADDAIYADTPTDLVTQADAYALDWGDPIPLVWKGRAFENTGVKIPEGIQTHTDAAGVEWSYSVRNDRTIAIGTTQGAIPASTPGSVTIPEKIKVSDALGELPVTTIGAKAFNGCSKVTKISIPANVTLIQPGAFNGCSNVTSFIVDSANASYKASTTTGALFTKDGKTLVKVPAAFRFKTLSTVMTTTVEQKIKRVYPEYSIVYTTVLDSPATTTSTSVLKTFIPDLSVSDLLASANRIADYAFSDTGALPEGSIANGSVDTFDGSTHVLSPSPVTIEVGTDSIGSTVTNMSNGTAVYTDSSSYSHALLLTETSTKTSYSHEIPFPAIPASVGYSKLAFYGTIWYDQVPADRLPTLSESATASEVAAAIATAADPRVIANITSAQDYNDFRAWSLAVRDGSGQLAGQPAVMGSSVAWTAFALDLDVLPAVLPTDDDLNINEYSIGGTDTFRLLLSIDGLEIGSKATEERLKTVFGITGAPTLTPSDFTADKVTFEFGTPTDGKVPVTVKPSASGMTTFFVKANLRQ